MSVGGLSLSSKITLNLLKLQYKIEISHFNMQLKQFFMRIKQRLRGEGEEVCKKELQLRESRVRQTATVAKEEGERGRGRLADRRD